MRKMTIVEVDDEEEMRKVTIIEIDGEEEASKTQKDHQKVPTRRTKDCFAYCFIGPLRVPLPRKHGTSMRHSYADQHQRS